MLSILVTLAAMAQSIEDSPADSWRNPNNPAAGTLGDWTYGYFNSGSFTPLPNVVNNTITKLNYWELTGGKPRVTKNTGTADKVSGAVTYPAHDYVVMNSKLNKPASVRFTADAAATYVFDTTFRAARTANSASATVSVQKAGVVQDGCVGSVAGLWSSASGNKVECPTVEVALAAGESVDFVVESGTADLYDDVALMVIVTDKPSDTDSDGLNDEDEDLLGTDPNLADTDIDGLEDGDEVNVHLTNPLSADTDSDGLEDGEEVNDFSTNPLSDDSDSDDLLDGDEIDIHGTDPNSNDSDSDTLFDGEEINDYGTDPMDADSDADGLEDAEEIGVYGTDPIDSDSDADGLEDGEEIDTYLTDPLSADSDGGGVSDGLEVDAGTDPLDPIDDVYGDSLDDSFDVTSNPSQGALGDWSYGYLSAGNFVAVASPVTNTWAKLRYWESPGGKPRFTQNTGTADKIWGGSRHPVDNYIVVTTKVGQPATVRFTADASGEYSFDASFQSARSSGSATTTASIQQNGAVVDGCTGTVNGQWLSLSNNLLECSGVTATLAAGESVDFVVDAGAKDNYDSVALKVTVFGGPDPSGDLDSDGLTYSEELALGTDPDVADTDGDGANDGDEVDNGTDPLVPDGGGGSTTFPTTFPTGIDYGYGYTYVPDFYYYGQVYSESYPGTGMASVSSMDVSFTVQDHFNYWYGYCGAASGDYYWDVEVNDVVVTTLSLLGVTGDGSMDVLSWSGSFSAIAGEGAGDEYRVELVYKPVGCDEHTHNYTGTITLSN